MITPSVIFVLVVLVGGSVALVALQRSKLTDPVPAQRPRQPNRSGSVSSRRRRGPRLVRAKPSIWRRSSSTLGIVMLTTLIGILLALAVAVLIALAALALRSAVNS